MCESKKRKLKKIETKLKGLNVLSLESLLKQKGVSERFSKMIEVRMIVFL